MFCCSFCRIVDETNDNSVTLLFSIQNKENKKQSSKKKNVFKKNMVYFVAFYIIVIAITLLKFMSRLLKKLFIVNTDVGARENP